MKISEYQDISGYMRDSRESLRTSIEQAAQDLHIRPKYLRAIENGELSGLPGKAYIRGYIKTYAEYLRLNPLEVLEAYESLLAPKGREFFVPEASIRENLPTRKIILWSLVGLTLLYIYWFFAIHDRSSVSLSDEMPEKFMHLLDKTAPPAMDKAWESCLTQADAGCFISLHVQQPLPLVGTLYDIKPANPPPQKP